MKHYEYCVCKDGWMMGAYMDDKKGAEDCAARYASQHPDSKVEIKVNVYDEMEYRYFKEVGC